MEFVERFLRLRTFAFHVTQRANLPRLSRTRRLLPAADLIRRSGELHLLRTRRTEPRHITVDGEVVVLQDQRPLIFANAALGPGWTEGDFVEFLNMHVFFWPGDSVGPIQYGERLWNRYAADSPGVLRIPSASLLAANRSLSPLFCAFNSGAPRMQHGQRVARGRDLFQPGNSFDRAPAKARELVFGGPVALPEETEVAVGRGQWAPILKSRLENLLD